MTDTTTTRSRPNGRSADAAAAAAQYVIDLENRVQELKDLNGQLEADIRTARSINTQLQADFDNATKALDHYKARNIEIVTKLQVAGKIILDAMQVPGGPETYAPGTPEQRALRAVRSEVDPVKSDEIPGFLRPPQ